MAEELDVLVGDAAELAKQRLVAGLQGVAGMDAPVSGSCGASVRRRQWKSIARRTSFSSGDMAELRGCAIRLPI